eukprot:CAMPEP_0115086212 /NCGR_PEP_ID=MMETSP0227-20121206/22440_1 /TAXON_ID=89957 /ORGANISM="Polarella glacialis, Strain CCMP 1383" /LENGTH=53 /DNA_ID=CAMNT_0002475605 /DNA_START=70 /DNA_END=228 /DNA_ORIENTATION=+
MSACSTISFLTLIIFLIIVTSAATTTQYWVHWLSILVVVLTLWLVNAMFLGEN